MSKLDQVALGREIDRMAALMVAEVDGVPDSMVQKLADQHGVPYTWVNRKLIDRANELAIGPWKER